VERRIGGWAAQGVPATFPLFAADVSGGSMGTRPRRPVEPGPSASPGRGGRPRRSRRRALGSVATAVATVDDASGVHVTSDR
jgi:hypothetical protein